MASEQQVPSDEEMREVFSKYYERHLFEASVLLKLVRRQAGNKNASEMLEALKVVLLSDISANLNEIESRMK